VKFEDYAAQGVAEYWIVDPDAEVVEQYLARDGRYELKLKSGSGELTSPTLGGMTLPIKAFFNQSENLAAIQSLVKQKPIR
jgi:Uma2 family endonuclease